MSVTGNGHAVMLDWIGLFKNAHVLVEMQSRALSEIFISLVIEGFDNETDPYGRKWAPRKDSGSIWDRLGSGRKILHGETTRLRNGWHVVQASRRGFRVAPSVEYAAYHQAPRFNRRPTRMMVPSGALGLPQAWKRDMFGLAEEMGVEYFSGDKTPGPSVKTHHASGGGGGGASHKAGMRRGKARAAKVASKRTAARSKRGNIRFAGQLVKAAIRGAKRAL